MRHFANPGPWIPTAKQPRSLAELEELKGRREAERHAERWSMRILAGGIAVCFLFWAVIAFVFAWTS